VNPASPRGLVPPRPNLGPEPWSDPVPIALILWVAGAVACLLLIWLARNRLRRGRIEQARFNLSNQEPRDTTPRGQLVALSHSVRELLASQFGSVWRAKTTEELAAEPQLAELLGHEQLQELIRFLDQVDRLKFAPARSNRHHESLERELAEWEPRLAHLKRKIQAKPDGRLKNITVRPLPRSPSNKVTHAETAPTARR
jgi:hypothetical protein